MAAEGTVLWKCGACEDCFYDLQALASHKCIGNTGTITLSEHCIKQLDEHSFAATDVETTSEQVEQAISAIAALEQEDEDNSNFDNDAENHVTFATQVTKRKKAKPTIISINNSLTSDKKFRNHQKGKRSLVWAYFNALDHKKAMCCLCSKIISYCGTPTTLMYHLSRYHPDQAANVKSQVNQMPGQTKYQYLEAKVSRSMLAAQCKTLKKNAQKSIIMPAVSCGASLQNKHLADKIVNLVIIDMLPPSIIDGKGFKQFCQDLDPQSEIPDSKTVFKTILPKKYNMKVQKIKESLKICKSVHLSLEMWEGHKNKKFLTFTCHFITDEFEKKCYTLCTSHLSDNWNGSEITGYLLSCISDWEISSKVVCIISVSSEMFQYAMKLGGIPEDSQHLMCLTHILDILVKETFQSCIEYDKLIQKCQKLILYIVKDSDTKQKFIELYKSDLGSDANDFEALDMETSENFLQTGEDIPGHWISVFYMLQKMSNLKDVLNSFLDETSETDFMLTEDEWLAIEEIISLLKPFKVVAMELSSEQYPPVSKVVPIFQGLYSLITNCVDLTVEFTKKIHNSLLSKLPEQLGSLEENLSLAVATILDPRFKNVAFQSHEAVDVALQNIKIEGRNCSKYVDQYNKNQTDNVSSETDSLWESFDKKATPRKECPISDDVTVTEIKNYFNEPLVDRKKEPVSWWKIVGSAKYPILAEIAKRTLSIPSTSAPPDRIFMEKKNSFLQKRQNIPLKYLDKLLFLNGNID